ncbi:MAG TPA: hypothetical protein VFK37_04730 [Bacillales bacterium]|nr:hypothetical protein [Bacillales bacterium]
MLFFFYMAAVILIIAVIYLYEWPKMEKGQKKERAVFVVLTLFDLILSGLLLLYPNMPGPSLWVQWLFRPFYPLLQ